MDTGDPDETGCPACGGRLIAWRSVPSAEPGLALVLAAAAAELAAGLARRGGTIAVLARRG